MPKDNVDFAAMIGSRICHDLISPIGAIMNGLEMMHLSEVPPSPEIDLIDECATHASARIRFFRLAYGETNTDYSISGTEIRDILDAMTLNGRVSYDWQVNGDVKRHEARVAFLGLQCLEAVLPRGGRITVKRPHTGIWQLVAEGHNMNMSADLAGMLRDGPKADALCAANVHFAMLSGVLRGAGRKPELEGTADTGTVTLRF